VGGDVAKAQAYFEYSLTVARAQQAKSWELRGHEPGAALERSGKTANGTYWFTEGFDTSDLRKAKVLLGELH
jgi:hypothetical protein